MDHKTKSLAEALIAPANAPWRHLSAGSILMLEMLGNPLADLNPETVDSLSDFHLLSAVWLHSVDLDIARATALAAAENPEGFRVSLMRWAENQPMHIFSRAAAWARHEVALATAAMAVPEKPGDSKNGSGPSAL